LQLGGLAPSNTLFSLESSDSTEVTVPASVMVAQGTSNAYFSPVILDDNENDGAQRVTITARAPGFGTGTTNLLILDNELDHFGFVPFGLVQTSTVPFQVRVTPEAVDDLQVLISENTSPINLSAVGDSGEVALQSSTPTLVNTVWRANVTVVNGAHTNVRLIARDAQGHTGTSEPFTVLAATNQLLRVNAIRIVGSDVAMDFTTVTGRHYRAEYASELTDSDWTGFADGLIGTGNILTTTNIDGALGAKRFYRVRLQP
jgi:hypothetical protein